MSGMMIGQRCDGRNAVHIHFLEFRKQEIPRQRAVLKCTYAWSCILRQPLNRSMIVGICLDLTLFSMQRVLARSPGTYHTTFHSAILPLGHSFHHAATNSVTSKEGHGSSSIGKTIDAHSMVRQCRFRRSKDHCRQNAPPSRGHYSFC